MRSGVLASRKHFTSALQLKKRQGFRGGGWGRRGQACGPRISLTSVILDVLEKETGVANDPHPWVGIIMGSKSDASVLAPAAALLQELKIPHEVRVVSAHRTPEWMREYARTAESRGLQVIIAGAGGAAHLPGMVASQTLLPVLGVPVPSTLLNGIDSLLSIVQMPKGVPVGTLAIGAPGAANAALLAAQILGLQHPELRERLRVWRAARTAEVLEPTPTPGGSGL